MNDRERTINERIGALMHQRRELLGLTLGQVAAVSGVCFQQVQKYEAGECGVSAARLLLIARCLSVSPDYFFEGIRGPAAPTRADLDEAGVSEFAESVAGIGNRRVRAALVDVARSLSASPKLRR